MTGGVAYGEKDRPLLLAGATQGLLAPRPPLDRVLGVQREVGRGVAVEGTAVRGGCGQHGHERQRREGEAEPGRCVHAGSVPRGGRGDTALRPAMRPMVRRA